MINIRKLLSRKKDIELVVNRSQAQAVVSVANRGYAKGGIDPTLAREASQAAEIATVAGAVIRERVESGDDYSHLNLQNSQAVSPKRVDRKWGEWLSIRRRV